MAESSQDHEMGEYTDKQLANMKKLAIKAARAQEKVRYIHVYTR